MASSSGILFVPTLDIDLVSHTHQLISEKYRSDCTKYVGRFIDQWVIFLFLHVFSKISDDPSDDKVEGLELSSAFDITCEAWIILFYLEYLEVIDKWHKRNRKDFVYNTVIAVVPSPVIA